MVLNIAQTYPARLKKSKIMRLAKYFSSVLFFVVTKE